MSGLLRNGLFLVGIAIVIATSASAVTKVALAKVYPTVKHPEYVDPRIFAEVDDKPERTGALRDEAELVEEEPVLEEIVEEVEETYAEEAYYEEGYENPVGYSEPVSEEGDLQCLGVVYGTDGTRYTWYSENVLPGGGLDIPGRHVGEDGVIRDENGNVAVASSDVEKGTVVDTPYGQGVVYDTGCPSGTVDIYTSW